MSRTSLKHSEFTVQHESIPEEEKSQSEDSHNEGYLADRPAGSKNEAAFQEMMGEMELERQAKRMEVKTERHKRQKKLRPLSNPKVDVFNSQKRTKFDSAEYFMRLDALANIRLADEIRNEEYFCYLEKENAPKIRLPDVSRDVGSSYLRDMSLIRENIS